VCICMYVCMCVCIYIYNLHNISRMSYILVVVTIVLISVRYTLMQTNIGAYNTIRKITR